MYQVFIDDRGKRDHSPVHVLAGYGATQAKWLAFSQEWNAILETHGLDHFHSVHVWAMRGKQAKWTSLERDGLLVQLIGCITRHAEHAFVVSFPFGSHAHWFAADEFPDKWQLRIYNMSYFAMVTQVHEYAWRRHVNEDLEIVFDEQDDEPVSRTHAGLDDFRELCASQLPGRAVAAPSFRSDKDCPPLQAADYLAWLVRREGLNAQRGVDRTQRPEALLLGEALSIPVSKRVL